MGRRKRVKGIGSQSQSAEYNDATFHHYYSFLRAIALSVYKWNGLPTEIDERFIELTLFERGLALFFHDDEYDKYFATKATPSGAINLYDNPTKYLAYGSNGYNKQLTSDNCVPIWNSYSRAPVVSSIELYARRLADIDRTIDINIHAQKTPLFIVCREEQRLTMLNMYKNYDGNVPVIFGTDAFVESLINGQPLQVLKTDAPYVSDKLLVDKGKIWAEIMTFLGVNNANQDKKERLVSDEVSANDGQIAVSQVIGLNARMQACSEINSRYGLNVSVSIRDSVQVSDKGEYDDSDEEEI